MADGNLLAIREVEMTVPKQQVRVARKFRLGEEPMDYEYWLTVSMKDRLDALLDLIATHHGWTDEAAPRLERVFAIVERR
ncbi:MAG: hypothetical protein IPP82_16605 [Xanthomonadales bacterium]|nr:hypothetical protein [Xanthomonadales bacterium]